MKNKNIRIITSIAIIFIFVFGIFYSIRIFNSNNKLNKTNLFNNEEFEIYSLNNITINDSNANLIFLDDLNSLEQKELSVKVGDAYTFNKYGDHTIKVLELTNEFIIISIEGLAPTKKTGGFSLNEEYNKVKILKNTGICLNVQGTDFYDGDVYLFYIN